ncbi:MAG: NAD(P)-binding domain-containing protein [Planctomycetes bacterium]|nr:NAD(P)-binding domain-containing protein [Planctomycetota bacterium]
MAVDTPARIAVLGAGPIGLEAALYARFLGYDVDIYERGNVADNILRWGHVRMFSPFGMNRSTLGLAALRAQDRGYEPPSDDEFLTGLEYADRYLLPLSQTDLLADHLKLGIEVVGVGRPELLKGEEIGTDERIDSDFRILCRDRAGAEFVAAAEVVIDTTGVFGNPNWAGEGGLPAIGEKTVRDRIEYGVPDVLGSARSQYANRKTLVIGAGYSAATTVVGLAKLAEEAPDTHVTWIVRQTNEAEPISPVNDDRLPERAALTVEANRLASGASPNATFKSGTNLHSVKYDEATGKFRVRLAAEGEVGEATAAEFDAIVANVGCRPVNRIYQELQIHECYATGGPMKLAVALQGSSSGDCLTQTTHGPQSLVTPEPDFYILGAKSYGRNPNFLVSIGREQVRDLFTIIGDREDLDLYKTAVSLPSGEVDDQ